MNSIKIGILVLFLAFFAMSCKNASANLKQDVTIELNNGNKWIVNTEMTPFILESEQLLLNYKGSDYETLAEQLKTKNNGLIKSCTMNGKSHDELHKWLHPHMNLIETLDDAADKAEADKIIDQLKISFQTYNTYFQ